MTLANNKGRTTAPLHLRVFLASPGDVADERSLALKVLEQLQYDPLLRGDVTVETVAWDKPSAGTPMLATLTPQEAIAKGLPKPSACDIVIVILWSRMGTPLPADWVKPDGTPYVSATEWEYLDALQAAEQTGQPDILVYRRTEEPIFRPSDPQMKYKIAQWEQVEAFFAGFYNPDGSIHRGYNKYPTPDAFERELTLHLRDRIRGFLKAHELLTVTASAGATPALPLWQGSSYAPSESKEAVTLIPLIESPEGQDHVQEMLRSRLRDPSRSSLPQNIIEESRKNLCPENPLEQLLGRQELLEKGCQRLLKGEFPILVYGIPGIGKSAFLAALVNEPEVREKYENNIFWINLRWDGVSTASEIADEIARGLHFSDVLDEQSSRSKLRTLRAAFADKLPKHLIVFDNADLGEQEVGLLHIYQKATPNIVVGSRIRFEIGDTEPLPLRELDRHSAGQMFRLHAKVDTDDAMIERICKLIGYHPLAIEVVASTIRLYKLTLDELAQNLEIKKLETLRPGVKRSERDIRAAFALLYDDLASSDECYVFDALGTFALCGAPLSAVARVTALPGTLCKQLLSRLQLSRLLVQESELDPGHYELHPLLYEFAREKLLERENSMMSNGVRFEDTLTNRMISFYVEYTDKHREDFSALEAAHDNVIHAAKWAWKNKAWRAVYNLWEASEGWLDATGDWNNLSSLLEWAVQVNRILKNREIELAKTLCSRSVYSELTGTTQAAMEAAMKDAKDSLELGYEVGDPKTVANGLVRVGSIYSIYGNAEQAHANFEEAWRICQDILDWDESAYIAYQLGLSYWWYRGDPTTARDRFKQSINISKKFPSHRVSLRYEAFCVTSLGNLLLEQEEYEQAREHLERSRDLKLELGDRYSTAISIASLAGLESRLGNLEKTIKLQSDALKIYKEIGAVSASLHTLQKIGDTYCQQERYIEAIVSYKEAKTIGLRTELSSELATTLLGLGTAYYGLGRYDEALAALRERLEVLATIPERDPYRVGITLRDIGKVYYRQGDLNEAQSYFEQAREELSEAGATDTLPAVLLQIGQEYAELGNHNKALVAYEEGLEMAKALPQENAHLKGAILYKMAKACVALRRCDEAIGYFEQACQILKGVATPSETVTVLEAFESTCKMVGLEDKAAEVRRNIDRTLAESAESTDGRTLLDLAGYYIGKEKLSKSWTVLDRVNKLLEQPKAGQSNKGEIRDLGLSYRELGRAYERESMYDEALASYQQAAQLLESRVGSQVYGVLMHDIGDVYRAQRKVGEALNHYEKAREYKKDEPRSLIFTLQVIADIHAEQEQYEEVLAVCKEALEKLDSLSIETE